MTTLKTAVEAPGAAAPPVSSYFRDYLRRLRGGDMGALPAVLGLLVLCTVFTIVRPVFLTPLNFANLLPQGAAVAVIAMGLVFVLLLGEIDLSAGYTSGVCASVLAMVLLNFHVPWWVAILAALVTGTAIGVVLGFLVAKVGIPSFVVTLAAFLAFQGVVLLIIKEGQIVSIQDPTVLAIGNKNLTVEQGWALFGIVVVGYAAVQLVRASGRRRRNRPHDPMNLIVLRVAALAAIGGAAIFVLNQTRGRLGSLQGVPMVVPILVTLLVGLTFVLKRTRYGLHLQATGGNREAARRAGINTDRITISAFMICSTLAAVGGIISASRANSVDARTGGSDVLLYAVGAAVIGGTSLFGGKGRVIDAVLGASVVAVINNGMGLLGYSSGIKFIVTGSVLLLAAGVDALSRKRAAAAGLR
jgi:D-xylose transport system permease protein